MKTESSQQLILSGRAAAPGIAAGILTILTDDSQACLSDDSALDISLSELERLDKAIDMTVTQLAVLANKAELSGYRIQSEIMELEQIIATDPKLLSDIRLLISNLHLSAQSAVNQVYNRQICRFEKLEDEHMRSRALDLYDIQNRIISNLQNRKLRQAQNIPDGSIIALRDISPSQFAALPLEKIRGLICEEGEVESHTAILAAGMKIPAVFECKDLLGLIKDHAGRTALINGSQGILIINPDSRSKSEYQISLSQSPDEQKQLEQFKLLPARTASGIRIELMANLNSSADLEHLSGHNIDGVGLMRTETLFLNREIKPDEEIQYLNYKGILKKAKNLPVVFRTFDLVTADDKKDGMPGSRTPDIPYRLADPRSRGLARSLQLSDEFTTQIRALLRAGAGEKMSIMFPMVLSAADFVKARYQVRRVQRQLISQRLPCCESFELGAMIETPEAAENYLSILELADFISIGSNDLAAYSSSSIFAQPNMNFISRLTQSARSNHSKRICLCGEIAAQASALPLWLALGLRTFSVAVHHLSAFKKAAAQVTEADLKRAGELIFMKLDSEVLERELKNLHETHCTQANDKGC